MVSEIKKVGSDGKRDEKKSDLRLRRKNRKLEKRIKGLQAKGRSYGLKERLRN